jgi:hypothetical protein
MLHNEQKGFVGKIFKRKQRTWNRETHGEPVIHESVFKRTKSVDNNDSPEYKPWILNHMDQNNSKIES